jgi:preprotein translocase subunit SecD
VTGLLRALTRNPDEATRAQRWAGVALLLFGSGPVRGFAVVHCLGILTSIFSAVFVSRALVNLVYGYRHRLTKISIGQVWRPGTDKASVPVK